MSLYSRNSQQYEGSIGNILDAEVINIWPVIFVQTCLISISRLPKEMKDLLPSQKKNTTQLFV
jgi:hypothetical protein